MAPVKMSSVDSNLHRICEFELLMPVDEKSEGKTDNEVFRKSEDKDISSNNLTPIND